MTVPKELVHYYPDLARIISQMISCDPMERPSIELIRNSAIFKKCLTGPILKRSYSEANDEVGDCVRVMVMLGAQGKWKARFVKLCGGKLLVFNKSGDRKARYCYELSECALSYTDEPVANVLPIGSGRHYSCDKMPNYVIRIEHRELETVYVRVESEEQAGLLSRAQLVANSIF